MPRPSLEDLDRRQLEFEAATTRAEVDALTRQWIREDLAPEPKDDHVALKTGDATTSDELFSFAQLDLIDWGIGKMASKLRKEFIGELNIVRERLEMPLYKPVVRIKAVRGASW